MTSHAAVGPVRRGLTAVTDLSNLKGVVAVTGAAMVAGRGEILMEVGSRKTWRRRNGDKKSTEGKSTEERCCYWEQRNGGWE